MVQSTLIEPAAPAVYQNATLGATEITLPQKERRRALLVPREHGAWGMLLIPLATGAAVGMLGRGHLGPVLLLTAAVLALFWLKTPVESWLGTGTLRVQTAQERALVRAVILPLAVISVASLCGLFWQGNNRSLACLGAIAGSAFGAQVFLKRMGRTMRMAAEVVGALALTTTAPAAYCVAAGRLDAKAWTLRLLNWLFAADQIHFVWIRIRGARAGAWGQKLALGWTFLAGNILLGATLALACYFKWLPQAAPIAFLPILFRGLAWFARKSQPLNVRHLGWTEMVHALVFATLLIAAFAF